MTTETTHLQEIYELQHVCAIGKTINPDAPKASFARAHTSAKKNRAVERAWEQRHLLSDDHSR